MSTTYQQGAAHEQRQKQDSCRHRQHAFCHHRKRGFCRYRQQGSGCHPQRSFGRHRQHGFSLVEVSIVTAIVLLLAIIGIPAIGGYVIENKVPKVGEELARFILQTTINAPNGSLTPYADIDTGHFAGLVRDSSIFSVSEAGAEPRVLHGLGGDGEVTVTPVEGGLGFAITLSRVNHAACPALSSVMQRVSETMTLASGGQGAAVIKDDSTPYSALMVQSRCGQGDVNSFVFTAS